MDINPPELLSLPGGRIDIRDARSGRTNSVDLVGFEIARTAVTRAEFGAVTAEGACDLSPNAPVHGITWLEAIGWCNAASEAEGLSPAYVRSGRSVEWNVAANGYRLPTEAEWEYACRAGSSGPHYGPLNEIAWTATDGAAAPADVGLKKPNDFGAFDMLGNVWEWCWDYADPARYGDYRTFRGGGWADESWNVRASVRRGSAPDAVLEDVGFRVARGACGVPAATSAQGWSAESDRERARVRGPIPFGWTPLKFD
ncbi:formylglycine-generating enzyme family protein [Arthrobacter sp. B2a2-09]|uniref:formylglycine-generating enzyme family protein n=1 Tax=Arthrobacter sp. B2a2-09 TaxID=2952822 RepID=UPI0022CD9DEB|nr:SUMF1/EgtB/PvdO family nonheme iron enzyme [Arthrobacter sp. B2a2-09]MCZ9883320.1 formylglycine-generating enzyme family protein [Arthrobacter sp. B2a2-09]